MVTDEAQVSATETKKRSKGITPAADINMKGLSANVLSVWKQKPDISLLWTNSAKYEVTVTAFANSLNQRVTTGSGRAAVTNELKTLDKIIINSTSYLKNYLKEKYGKDSYTAYFPQFGIVQEGKVYMYPSDRNKRLAALQLTVKSIVDNGFKDNKYGQAYWQDILTRYEAAIKLSVTTDGSVSGLVSTKNEARKQIQKTLNALIHIIKGNYPDTYASVLREWGFQKEKY